MTKDDWYNQLLQQVQGEGGYIAFNRNNRPVITLMSGDEDIIVSAIFEGTDDSSPLKVIDIDFCCWDLYDYITAVGIIEIIETYNKQKKGA